MASTMATASRAATSGRQRMTRSTSARRSRLAAGCLRCSAAMLFSASPGTARSRSRVGAERERMGRRTAGLQGRPMHAPAEPATRGLFQHPPFLRFWWARVLTTLAFQMQAVALGWQIYDLTGNVSDLGLVGLVQFA